MVKISPFHVEQWMDKYETTPGVLNVAETCCSSISMQDLISFDTREKPPTLVDFSTKLTYGEIRGSNDLRSKIASLYNGEPNATTVSPDSVVVMQGAISANSLVLYTLIGPGDHVICVYPTYQQLYTVPESLGASVSLWRLEEKDGWVPSIETLKSLIKTNTKVCSLAIVKYDR
jgi:aspartate/methionine/tyrosine aminotransferase